MHILLFGGIALNQNEILIIFSLIYLFIIFLFKNKINKKLYLILFIIYIAVNLTYCKC